MRIVLVGRTDADWRIYRQTQWMGEVRGDPRLATLPRRHFDIEEGAFLRSLDDWKGGEARSSLAGAIETLARLGAVEVVRDHH